MKRPNSTITLYKAFPYDSNYDYVKYYSSKSSITTFLSSYKHSTISNYVFVREHEQLKVPVNIDDLEGVNYLSYKNSGKTYYCFIDSKEYINEGLTGLNMVLDVWTTYFHDITIEESYVEREHTVPSDVTLLDEGFTLGNEYKLIRTTKLLEKDNAWQLSFKTSKQYQKVKGGKENSSGKVIEFEEIPTGKSATCKIDGITQPIGFTYIWGESIGPAFDALSSSNSLIEMTQVAKMPTYSTFGGSVSYITEDLEVAEQPIQFATSVNKQVISTTVNPTVGGYDGLFESYPYSYSMIADYINNPLIIKHEYMTTNYVHGMITYGQRPCDKWFNQGYCGDETGRIHNLKNYTYATLPIPNNLGAQYLLENKNSLEQAQASRITNVALGVATIGAGVAATYFSGGLSAGATVGAITAGVGMINNAFQSEMQQLARTQDITQQPIGITGSASSTEMFVQGTNRVDFLTFTISDEIKQRIYAFWKRYGFKCNKVKVPKLTSSLASSAFVKTNGLRARGNVDDRYMKIFKQIFDHGVTIDN